MDNKLKFQQLECYKLATDEQKEKLNKEQYFDLDKLPENQLQTEFVEYIYYRGTQVSILTIKRERHYFNSLCEFFQKSSHQENSLLDREKDFWIKQLKMWMIQNGRALTKHKVTNIQTESVEKAALVTIRMPVSLISSRSASSCRRFVSFSGCVSKRNWSTDI